MNHRVELISCAHAETLYRKLSANLPEYFGLAEANERYAKEIQAAVNFAVLIDEQQVGLLSLNFPYPTNANIYWLAVQREYQGQGLGHLLVQEATTYAVKQECKTLTVETLAPSKADKNYLRTFSFYEKQGFSPLFNLRPENYDWTMVYLSKPLMSPLQKLITLEKDARHYGFDWPDEVLILEQALSECAEIKDALDKQEPSTRIQEEIGDLIHTSLSLCIFSGFEPEDTLLKVVDKFGARMQALKAAALALGLTTLKGQSLEFMLDLWKQAKLTTSNGPS